MPRKCCVSHVTCGYKGWTSGKQDGCQFRQSGHRFKNIHLRRNILPASGSPDYLLFAAKYLNNTGLRLRLSRVKIVKIVLPVSDKTALALAMM